MQYNNNTNKDNILWQKQQLAKKEEQNQQCKYWLDSKCCSRIHEIE